MDFDKKFDLRKLDSGLKSSDIKSVLNRLGYRPNGSIERMLGGFSSLNYRFRHGSDDLVFRVSGKPADEFLGEISVMQKVRNSVPVPKVLYYETDVPEINKNVAVVSFMEGDLLSHVEDQMNQFEIEDVGASVGKQLAHIHHIEFPESGFFGEGCRMIETINPFRDFVWSYIQKQFKHPLLLKRLGKYNHDNLGMYLRENDCVLDTLPCQSNLTHSDFNQKNILVKNTHGKWHVSAILDWEFSFSGAPMMDFGNFFRYEDELSPFYEKPFLTSYKSEGGKLTDNWREQARYLDLTSMMQFLIREDECPKTFYTATSVILKTLNL